MDNEILINNNFLEEQFCGYTIETFSNDPLRMSFWFAHKQINMWQVSGCHISWWHRCLFYTYIKLRRKKAPFLITISFQELIHKGIRSNSQLEIVLRISVTIHVFDILRLCTLCRVALHILKGICPAVHLCYHHKALLK